MEIINTNKNKSFIRKIRSDKFLKGYLERCYIDEKKSLAEISRICDCDVGTIKRKLKKYRIPIRPHGAFLVGDDGESLNSKFNRGEISESEYRDYEREYLHNKGIGTGLTMSENKDCSMYLGVHICENKEFISKIINIIENMPNCNPGYDVVCGRGKKIDVKCACLSRDNEWVFIINNNKIADYFLMISFDDRENLNVQHIWLVKGDAVIEKTTNHNSKKFIVNEKDSITIGKGNRSLKRWIKHEITDTYKLEEAQKLCNVFKKSNIASD